MIIELCDAELSMPSDQDRKRQRAHVLNAFNNTDAKFLFYDASAVWHGGYLGYLDQAWRRHFSIVLRPDDLWHMAMCELAKLIRENPKETEHIFTSTPGQKQLLVVPTNDIEHIDPNLIVDELRKKVPITSLFMPEFSTTTKMAMIAREVAFADVCSPYYSYGTFLCGIPRVRVDGFYEDWLRCVTSFEKLAMSFGVETKIGKFLIRCMNRTVPIARAMVDGGKEGRANLFKKMVRLQRCGSGSQYEMNGWILDYTFEGSRNIQTDELPHHIARLNYTNLDTNRQFTLFAGCWHSNLNDGWVVPEFGLAHCEWKARQVEKGEWTPGRYARGSTVVRNFYIYEAVRDTDDHPLGDQSKDWKMVGEVPLTHQRLVIESTEIKHGTNKLSVNWTIEES